MIGHKKRWQSLMKFDAFTHNELIKFVAHHPEDREATKEFYRRYYLYICFQVRSAMKRASEYQLVEDVVQEVLCILYKKNCRVLKNFRGENQNAIFEFLGKIARFETYRFLKKLSGGPVDYPGELPPAAPKNTDPRAREIREETEICLEQILKGKRHRERDKLVFKYYYFHDMKVEEIPGALNIDLSTKRIYNIINDIEEKLKPCLKARLAVSNYSNSS